MHTVVRQGRQQAALRCTDIFPDTNSLTPLLCFPALSCRRASWARRSGMP
jgi:hypothetical protein